MAREASRPEAGHGFHLGEYQRFYTPFALISMFIRQREIAGRTTGGIGGGGREGVILRTSSLGN